MGQSLCQWSIHCHFECHYSLSGQTGLHNIYSKKSIPVNIHDVTEAATELWNRVPRYPFIGRGEWCLSWAIESTNVHYIHTAFPPWRVQFINFYCSHFH